MKRTRWFGKTIKPVHIGEYEWQHSSARRYWDGVRWLDSLGQPMTFFKPWRGILK